MKFAIRDDDTNFFTNPEDLEKIYSRIWNICPISLTVVPFIASMKSPAIPEKYWQGDRIFSIGENKKLVEFLKSKISENKISILMHGYSHKNYENGYEFEVGENLYEKVRKGKKYLQELFEVEIKTFVPPHNSLSKEGMKAVIANKLNILGSFSFRLSQRPFQLKNIFYFLKRKNFQGKNKTFFYPFVMCFTDHSELDCCSLIPSTSLEDLIEKFDLARRYNGDFCLTTHYWEVSNLQTLDTFRRFWEYVNKFNNISHLSVNKIFERFELKSESCFN